MTNFLSLVCALALLAGALAVARHGANDVSFVELGHAAGPPAAAAVPPQRSATLPA